MANALAPAPNEEETKRLIAIRQRNQLVLDSTLWQWARLGNELGATATPTYAVNTLYKFNLVNTSAYCKKIRIWLEAVKINNTGAQASLNRNGFYQLLGTLTVRLGNQIYRVPGGALPLLWQSFARRGDLASFRGNQTYGYSASLFVAPATIAATSGSSTYTGYVDIPLALLERVKDPDGIAPTLANAGLEVEFTTPTALTGTDPFLSPFTAGTLAIDGTNPGHIEVFALLARQVTVSDTGPLPGFVVGPAFVVEAVAVPFYQAETFYPFQGQQANLILVKTIIVIDSPGELANEYSNPTNILAMDLMYDADTPVIEDRDGQEPFTNLSYPANFLVEQGKAIGDQPPGVSVFDFGRGTNADYPNSLWYLNLEKFSRAGVRVKYNVAPQAGAQIHFVNVYLRPKFYQAKAS